MSGGSSTKAHKPRELRRRVVLSARLRHGISWSDASILNLSSRGLLIHTARPLEQGSAVELRRGDYVINARVVWRQGGKAGLEAEERVPVESMASGDITDTRPIAALPKRGFTLRTDDRVRGRVVEFAGVATIALVLAAGTLAMVEQALARPLALVASVLG